MKNQQLLTDELQETTQVDETAVLESGDPVDSITEQEQPSLQSTLDMLIAKRTGFFGVKLEDEDLKWIKNACKGDKFKFVGPNEAFMVMNCFLGFSSAISKKEESAANGDEQSPVVMVQASAVEAAAILLSKYEGNGLDSAQRVFRIAVALNDSVMEMKQLDELIRNLKTEQALADEAEQAN
jgi:hypothetical protein